MDSEKSVLRVAAERSFLKVGAPLFALATPQVLLGNEGSQGLRNIDIGPLTDVFTHTGNMMNSVDIVGIVVTAYGIAQMNEEKEHSPLVVAATGAGLSVAANVAFETMQAMGDTVHMHMDWLDAGYGSVAGIILSASFCYAAYRERRKRRQQDRLF